MNTSTLTPHDRFFRAQMKNPKVAREFFEANLPDFLKGDVDLSTLKLRKDSFVGDDLRLQMADMLFEVSVKGEKGYFYALCEHQSTPQKLMPFRLLQYMVAIQKQHLEEHKTTVLPFVYPLVIYAGKDKYAYSMDLFTLFGPHENLAREVWQNPYQLVDLTQTPDDALAPYLYFGTTAFMMKHIRDQDALAFLGFVLDLLKKIEKTGELGYVKRCMTYVIEAGQILDGDAFVQLVTDKLSTLKEQDIMTLAEQWQQQGLKKGLQQGMQQGMQEGVRLTALGMLQENLSLGVIAKITGLSESEIQNLRSNA